MCGAGEFSKTHTSKKGEFDVVGREKKEKAR